MSDHDHTGEPKLWCVTHQHPHIASIPRFTYLCKDCGWGQWYRIEAKSHEADCPGHETYEVEHIMQPLSDGAALIGAERARHVTEEGYDAEHDAGHASELIGAAREYAALARFEMWNPDLAHPELIAPQIEWPWHRDYFKPTGDVVRDLTKAGALIAAAIDSLRTTPTEGATP
jgi:hypothetical protein